MPISAMFIKLFHLNIALFQVSISSKLKKSLSTKKRLDTL